jgi:hypothetical protein
MSFFRRNHSHALGAVSGFAAFTSLLLSGSALAGQAEILWDTFGTPTSTARTCRPSCAASVLPKWKITPRRS